jgi:hypothetical protein
MLVYHSVRKTSDTKTEKSRRRLALPQIAVTSLAAHKDRQAQAGWAAGGDYVFCGPTGARLTAKQVRTQFVKLTVCRDRRRPARWRQLGSARAAAHLCQRAERCRRGPAEHRGPRRAQQHADDPNRLPTANPADPGQGRGGHGCHLPRVTGSPGPTEGGTGVLYAPRDSRRSARRQVINQPLSCGLSCENAWIALHRALFQRWPIVCHS